MPICSSGVSGWLGRLLGRRDHGYNDGYRGLAVSQADSSICVDPCQEVVEEVPTGNYHFVGHGRGTYHKMDHYRYVGGGAEAHYEPAAQAAQPRRSTDFLVTACCYCTWCSLVAIVVGAVVLVAARAMAAPRFDCSARPVGSWSTGQRDWCCASEGRGCLQEVQSAQATEYDCDDDATLGHSPASWSGPKQAWCCEFAGRGCPQGSQLVQRLGGSSAVQLGGSTSPPPFDCSEGLDSFEDSWPDSKKTWCCSHERLGCPPYNCLNLTDANSWDDAKKVYCCEHESVACASSSTLPSTSTSQKFDCDAGKGDPSSWTLARKVSCCIESGIGCPTTTPTPRYDCKEGIGEWQTLWSDEKMDWCCSHEARGCPAFSCRAAESETWSAPQREWCCQRKRAGCATTATTTTTTTVKPRFDCLEGDRDWLHTWPRAKREYCCSREGRGCPDYNCTASELGGGVEGWPEAQRWWCCENEHVGCTTTTGTSTSITDTSLTSATLTGTVTSGTSATSLSATSTTASKEASLPFDCRAGFGNWRAGWSDRKKDWCCIHVGRGCPYSCDADAATAEEGWSAGQRQWCCWHAGRGCTSTTTSLPFDCSAGFAKWRDGWSRSKKDWCCSISGVACETTSALHDCQSGLDDWEEGWSTGKKQWCCEHDGVGCDPPAPAPAVDWTLTFTSTSEAMPPLADKPTVVPSQPSDKPTVAPGGVTSAARRDKPTISPTWRSPSTPSEEPPASGERDKPTAAPAAEST